MGPAEWIALVALVLALIALPTVFQMLWGRPQIEIRFLKHDIGNASALLCACHNRPISNRFFRALGVVRESADISVGFQIFDENMKKIGDVIETEITYSGSMKKGYMVELHPHFEAFVRLIFARNGEVEARVCLRDDKLGDKLPLGTYHAVVVVMA